MPQIWTSDDSDAIERLKIQYGTSLVYPTSAMVGHVSACPNHQTGRVTSFKTRGDVAQICNFGYELNVGMLEDDEKAMIKEQTAKHREIEDMVLEGDCVVCQYGFVWFFTKNKPLHLKSITVWMTFKFYLARSTSCSYFVISLNHSAPASTPH